MAALACLLVGIASLTLPSGPTYDPYAWLIWGRDLAHLDLVTTGGGTSWKPLPAIVDALLTPLGGAAADGWLVVARAGALFAVVLAFRLAWRLAPSRRVLAGTCAAATLVLTREWLRRNGVGDAEGLLTAFGLLAFERHLDEKRGQAFALIIAASLVRVEAWPFAIAYGGWLWWRGEHRIRLALGVATIPLLWFGGDWIGSGSATTAASRALHVVPGSPGASAHPALAVLRETAGMLPFAAWIAVGAAIVVALRRPAPDRRALALLLACATGWIGIVALMAERGYAGLPRFLFMAAALIAVVAGIGASHMAEALGSRRRSLPAAAMVLAAFAAASLPNIRPLPSDLAAVDKVADTDASLVHKVETDGGAAALRRCGTPETSWYTVTALAYDLGVPTSAIQSGSRSARLPARPCRAAAGSPRRDRS